MRTSRFFNLKAAPSNYPRIPLYVIHALQIVSSIVVVGIMWYFVSSLRNTRLNIPWTFIIHLVVSIISTISLCTVTIIYAPAPVPAAKDLLINGILAALWALSFGLLTNSLKNTIAGNCGTEIWNNSTGIMVCRLYKTLFSFDLAALISTLAALALDLYINQKHNLSSSYHRTTNPKLEPMRNDDSELGALAPPPTTRVQLTGFLSPDNPDDQPLSFPNTPNSTLTEESESHHRRSRSEQSNMRIPLFSPGSDISNMPEETGFSYLEPSAAHGRPTERGYRLPDE